MVIETKRTHIRYFKEEDAEDLFNYLSMNEVYEYEPGSPISMEDAKSIAQERAKGKNFIAVCCRETGKLIGHFSFFFF